MHADVQYNGRMRAKRLLNLMGDRLHTLPLLVLYLTDGCNSRCVTCDIWRSPRRNMSAELVSAIASASHELGVRWVLLSGGEAMQHPQWPQIARRFRQTGAHVMLLTNALFLRRQADDLVGNVDEVIVSLDGGTASTYQAIRGVDGFDQVLEGIQAARQRGLPVTTRTTVQKANFRELPRIIEAARAVDVNRISFLAVDVSSQFAFGPRFTTDGPPSLSPALSPAEVDELSVILDGVEQTFPEAFADGRMSESPAKLRRILVDYFRALHGGATLTAPRCNAPHFSTVIEVDGTLRPCYFLPSSGQFRAGESLRQALNSDAAVALREAYRTGKRAECVRCVCPLYKSPRALVEM